MMARARDETGASLILALVFITVIGVVAAALASLGFTSQKAAAVYSDQRAVTNMLDSGVQAAIENARVAEPFECAALRVPDAHDSLQSSDVTCDDGGVPPTQKTGELTFTAQICPPPAAQPPSIRATVAFSTIGDADSGARIARTMSWKVVPTTTACPPSP